ncbi:MAG: hypothetical protein J5U17_13290 [Candidatus Methanoperedens sp.]|nr:hypothetical protein [Candidatus Methanoperedens sp.]
MQQSITDFLSGLSKSIIEGLIEAQKLGGIGNSIKEGIEKTGKKLFITGVAISIAGTGFFLTLWGIASAIDARFAMRGLGYVLIGLEAGIVYPTAVTQGLWNRYIEPPESLKGFQDMQGRLWDVLTMFSFSSRAMKKANIDMVESQKDTAQTLYFKTIFQMPSKAGNPKMETVDLKAICGPGDNAEPILTIMLLEED